MNTAPAITISERHRARRRASIWDPSSGAKIGRQSTVPSLDAGHASVEGASVEFFDDYGSVYVWLCTSGQGLQGHRRRRSEILKSEDITRS